LRVSWFMIGVLCLLLSASFPRVVTVGARLPRRFAVTGVVSAR
jgi:hypothetical protein